MEDQIKILAIENDEFMKIFLKDAFWIHDSQRQFEISIVDDFGKAEKIIKDASSMPVLIFFDVLPFSHQKVDVKARDLGEGLNFLKRLKEDSSTKDIKTIGFCTYGDEELENEFLKLGGDKFLVHGENLPQELLTIVRRVLGLK